MHTSHNCTHPVQPLAASLGMAPPRSLSRLRSVDFYKKIPSDLTEATLTGAWLSIVASIIMSTLLVLVSARPGLESKLVG